MSIHQLRPLVAQASESCVNVTEMYDRSLLQRVLDDIHRAIRDGSRTCPLKHKPPPAVLAIMRAVNRRKGK